MVAIVRGRPRFWAALLGGCDNATAELVSYAKWVLAGGPVEKSTAEQMKVKMGDGLAGTLVAVDHDAVAGEPLLLGDLDDGGMQVAEKEFIP